MLAFLETLGKCPICSQVFLSVKRDRPSLLSENVMQTGGELSLTFFLGCGPYMTIINGQSNELTGVIVANLLPGEPTRC